MNVRALSGTGDPNFDLERKIVMSGKSLQASIYNDGVLERESLISIGWPKRKAKCYFPADPFPKILLLAIGGICTNFHRYLQFRY